MASLYWVGGTATWDATAGTKWATSSGGAGGAPAPTAADDVFFTSSSTGTITLSSASVARSINCTGFTGTISHPSSITLNIGDGTAGAGNIALLFVSGMTYTKGNTTSSAISFVSTSSTQQSINWGGKTPGNVTFNGAGGSWQLQSTHSASSTTVTLTAGALDTNGQTCIWSAFSSNNTNTRSLTLGASAFTLSGSSPWTINATGLTFSAGTSSITCTGQMTFVSGGLTYATLIFTGLIPSISSSTVTTATTVTVTGTAVKNGTFNPGAGGLTVTGTLTVNGNSAINRVMINSGNLGVATTITAAAVSMSNVDFRDITAAGTANWDLSNITGNSGDGGGNSGITFTPSTILYWFSNTGNWSDSTKWFLATNGGGGTGRVPLPQDDAVFDGNSFSSSSQTTTFDISRSARNITWTGVTNTPTLNFNAGTNLAIMGGLTLTSGMALSGTTSLEFTTRSASTLTSAGLTFPNNLLIRAPSGSVTLQDDLVCSGTITQQNGTFDANTRNVTFTTFTSTVNASRTLNMSTGTWTSTTTTTSNIWNVGSSGLTLNGADATIRITNASSNTRTFIGGGFTYGTLNYTINGSAGMMTITGSNTFNTINFSDTTSARTLRLTAGTTTTVTNFNVSGTPGVLMRIESSSAGSVATLSKTSGVVSRDYLNIQDSTATGGAQWFAGTHSNDLGNNSGWVFSGLPVSYWGTRL